jgi:hypothetical protein
VSQHLLFRSTCGLSELYLSIFTPLSTLHRLNHTLSRRTLTPPQPSSSPASSQRHLSILTPQSYITLSKHTPPCSSSHPNPFSLPLTTPVPVVPQHPQHSSLSFSYKSRLCIVPSYLVLDYSWEYLFLEYLKDNALSKREKMSKREVPQRTHTQRDVRIDVNRRLRLCILRVQ